MRLSREKIPGGGCYYHLMNRVTGDKHSYPFTDVNKKMATNLLKKLSSYYLLEIIAYCWMGNHFHIIAYAPHDDELPDEKTVLERHNHYYSEKPDRQVIPEDKELVAKIRRNMSDISHFMKSFQQAFTYNINHESDRRGTLWADRFKSTILEGNDALWTAVEYVELNPVRAGLVEHSADYRHCSWGWYKGSGTHKFKDNFIKHMKKAIGEFAWTEKELFSQFEGELTRIIASEKGVMGEELAETVKKARKGETMPVRFLRRTRHWTDGGIIGSKEFIQKTACYFRDNERVMKKKFSHGKTVNGNSLYCYKILRKILA